MAAEAESYSNCRSSRYNVLSNEQTGTLQKFYNEGMTSTASNMRDLIEEAAGETVDQVKVYFYIIVLLSGP